MSCFSQKEFSEYKWIFLHWKMELLLYIFHCIVLAKNTDSNRESILDIKETVKVVQ
jgi:hypothetical protein